MISKRNLNLKFRENKSACGLNEPRYMITYKAKSSEEENCKNSFEIISALKGSNDVLIEFNSSLLMFTESRREICVANFIKAIRTMNLSYKYRKSAPIGKKSFISQILGGGNKEAHEVLVYIPSEIWEQEGFNSLLPTGGLRYYITNGPSDGTKILEDVFNGQMMEDEKIDLFSLIIFDSSCFGQMGIVSNHMSFDEVKQLLGV